MNSQVKKDMSNSSAVFKNYIWDVIKTEGSTLKMVEDFEEQDSMRAKLDQLAGIDAWIIKPDGIIGIANRTQWSEKPWDSFTVRLKRDSGADTECKKRIKAIFDSNELYLYPTITIQSYVTVTEGVIRVGSIKTKTLFDAIRRGRYKTNRTDNASFLYVDWDIFADNEISIFNINI